MLGITLAYVQGSSSARTARLSYAALVPSPAARTSDYINNTTPKEQAYAGTYTDGPLERFYTPEVYAHHYAFTDLPEIQAREPTIAAGTGNGSDMLCSDKKGRPLGKRVTVHGFKVHGSKVVFTTNPRVKVALLPQFTADR